MNAMAGRFVETRLLQVAVGLGGIVPFVAGGSGVVLGGAMTGAHVPADLDSHVRYLSGLLLAIGFGFWSTIPAIEARGPRFRLLTAIVVAGGLARLGGVVTRGWPGAPMLFGLAMELGVTPALCLWQMRVAARR